MRPRIKVDKCQVDPNFFRRYLRYWRIAWGNGVGQAIEKSPITRMYQFTSDFRSCVYDIQYWTFEKDFFQQYPDFLGSANQYDRLLAVRINDRDDKLEKAITKAKTDPAVNRIVQEYFDSMARLQDSVRANSSTGVDQSTEN